jgi:hypothetical protein
MRRISQLQQGVSALTSIRTRISCLVFAMEDHILQLRLGAPLFLFALIILNAIHRPADGSTLPRVQPVTGYTCVRLIAPHRRRLARALVQIVGLMFCRTGLWAPAGLCLDAELPRGTLKLGAWVHWLACLDSRTALRILCESATSVPASVYKAVENEYNEGLAVAAGLLPELGKMVPDLPKMELQPGSLLRGLIELGHRMHGPAVPDTPRPAPVEHAQLVGQPCGTFFKVLVKRAVPHGKDKVRSRYSDAFVLPCLCL